MPRELTRASTLDSVKKEAKRWLKALRAGDERARARLRRSCPDAPLEPGLRHVQHALAVEHGLSGWRALRQQFAGRAATGATLDLIEPEEFGSERPYGPWSSRGCDLWETIRASCSGDVATLRRLLERDPNLSRYPEPLHFAVREGHLEAIRVLLDAGADADIVAAGGENLIVVARDRGHEEVARFLEGVVNRSRTKPADMSSVDHAIHAAAAANDLDGIRRMLDLEPELVHRGDRKGGTPLHRAVLASAHQAIELLLDRGADLHAVHGSGPGDDSGYAPVDFEPMDLALFWHGRGDLETARLLLRRGAVHDLTIAAAFGDLDRVARILDQDPAQIHAARRWGKRPLSAAVEFGHEAIVRLLLDRGADPTGPKGRKRRGDSPCTPRPAAATAGSSSCCSTAAPIPTLTSIPRATPRGRRRRPSCARSCLRGEERSTATIWSGSAKTMKSCVA